MGRPKNNDYPPYMTRDGDIGGFVVRNPITGKKRRFAASDEKQAREAGKALGEWVEKERRARLLDAGRPTIAALVDWWIRDKLQFQPWDTGTRRNFVFKLNRIKRELGTRSIIGTDCMFLEEWIASFCHTADAFNKWRYAFVKLFDFAVSRKLVSVNEAAKTEERSTSKKLEVNRKVRQQITIDGFKAIHQSAPGWLQIAMELSLVTLQARNEICNMKQSHFRDGHLFVIRDKTSGDSDMAFIKIALTPDLEDVRRRSLIVKGVTHLPSSRPYLVWRAPASQRRQWIENKPHWSYVTLDYLTKSFQDFRDRTGFYAHLKPDERPSFHEIRGLGARILLERGIDEAAIQALMTHSNPRTTQIYLDRGAAALTDDDYNPVSAPLGLKDMLK